MGTDTNEPQAGGTKELDLLIQEAGGMEADRAALAPEAVAAAQEEAQQGDLIRENGQAIYTGLEIAVPLLAGLFPSVGAIYTDEVKQRVAGALAPVCAKYGWEIKGIGGQYKEEIGAAIVLLPLALATYKGVQADMLASRNPVPVLPGKSSPIMAKRVPVPGDVDYKEPEAAAVLG